MSKIIILKNDNETKMVEVPSISFGFDVNNYAMSSELMYMIPVESINCDSTDEILKTIALPKGNWKIISKTSKPQTKLNKEL